MKRWTIGLFCLVSVCLSSVVHCQQPVATLQQVSESADRLIFDRYRKAMVNPDGQPLGERMVQTALYFVGTPYVAATLEREPEQLVINLRELDCTTFVESVLALSLTLPAEEASLESYSHCLQTIRYRKGVITDYTDRLHYFSDWIYENEQFGRVKEVTEALGGVALQQQLSFMSTHPESYPALRHHPERVEQMAHIEQQINARNHYYIPKSSLHNCVSGIRNGDIVSFVTSIKGLDVTHVGIAYWRQGTLTFIHASSAAKRVVVQPESLSSYIARNKSCKGIRVVRPTQH